VVDSVIDLSSLPAIEEEERCVSIMSQQTDTFLTFSHLLLFFFFCIVYLHVPPFFYIKNVIFHDNVCTTHKRDSTIRRHCSHGNINVNIDLF